MAVRASCAVLAVLFVASLTACGGGQEQSPPATTAPAAEPAAEAEEPAAVAEGGFGVEECDSFFTAYFTCIDENVPEAGRAALRAAAEQTREALQQAASTPEGKEGLVQACQQAEEAARQAMAAYDCEW